MEGWIKLHRQLIESPEWTDSSSEQKAILITLLCMVNFEPTESVWDGKKIQLKPGQMITSLNEIAKRSGTSVKNVRTALAAKETANFLAMQTANAGRLITICKWEHYQGKNIKGGKQSGKVSGNEIGKPPYYINVFKKNKEDKEVVGAEQKISTTANILIPKVNAEKINAHLNNGTWLFREIERYYPNIYNLRYKLNLYQADRLYQTYGEEILTRALLDLENKTEGWKDQQKAIDAFARKLKTSPSNLRRIIV